MGFGWVFVCTFLGGGIGILSYPFGPTLRTLHTRVVELRGVARELWAKPAGSALAIGHVHTWSGSGCRLFVSFAAGRREVPDLATKPARCILLVAIWLLVSALAATVAHDGSCSRCCCLLL